MFDTYSDEERLEIAKKQYDDWKPNYDVTLENNKVIGVVSQVNNKSTGEQSFVITDKYVPPTASLAERNQVQEITVLYRGSTAPSVGNVLNPFHKEHSDVVKDWIHNDVPTAVQILNGGAPVVTPQLQSSAKTLQEAMNLYPNAQVYVYGHSLGSMDAQYAIANVNKNDISRINGGFFYQGPNVYSNLTPKQQDTINALNSLDKLFNYVDSKDIVPIGYGLGKPTVGHLIRVDSKKVGFVDQHMWGGYQFDKDGNILTDKEGSLQLAKYATNQQLSAINNLRKNFMKSGGGLSSSEEIFLDAAEGLAITQGMKQTIQGEIRDLKAMFDTAIENAKELWKNTLSDARGVGSKLSEAEILTALSNGGATEAKIVVETVQECEESLAEATKIEQEYDQLLQQINEAIKSQVETDQQLAKQIGSMYG
ncbi:DUF2974 domain-containing protein [Enterococcus sp. DIV0242_7C1]|uniref:Uncharacterized protein n=1 Tax=Candidatus Enterococcus dunnyi TaxID=1834192 RepID=A0A200J194_9ENTE|nr:MULTISPECIES: DUF2974 domain-containing protein [unclassified Enterococcus]MBO0470163.1 DUF2974 domain-containing protein [Enterococcus sp. DIV0242_7C1]OUZ30619.1 hypothetical protein A5889_002907 [Enterococcus sp. 9D6_DIV0238]